MNILSVCLKSKNILIGKLEIRVRKVIHCYQIVNKGRILFDSLFGAWREEFANRNESKVSYSLLLNY
jgi:hypothetical protein